MARGAEEGLRAAVGARLAAAGCVAPFEEADELLAAAADRTHLEELVARREHGEPLAWVTGSTRFLGVDVRVQPGVYVPRPQTEPLARRAVNRLPDRGNAADLCTGSGAVALAVANHRPRARVVATDLDPVACRCAAANGVEVYLGDLAEPLPVELRGRLDVVVAVAPYVPTEALGFLPTDARDHEPPWALDGGPAGTDVLERVVVAAAEWLRPGGSLLIELGGGQDRSLARVLADAGFDHAEPLEDDEGDLRGIEAVLTPPRSPTGRGVTT